MSKESHRPYKNLTSIQEGNKNTVLSQDEDSGGNNPVIWYWFVADSIHYISATGHSHKSLNGLNGANRRDKRKATDSNVPDGSGPHRKKKKASISLKLPHFSLFNTLGFLYFSWKVMVTFPETAIHYPAMTLRLSAIVVLLPPLWKPTVNPSISIMPQQGELRYALKLRNLQYTVIWR